MVVIIDWSLLSSKLEQFFSCRRIHLSLNREEEFILYAINILYRVNRRNPSIYTGSSLLFEGLSIESVIELQFLSLKLYQVIYDNLPNYTGNVITVEKTTRSTLYLRLT